MTTTTTREFQDFKDTLGNRTSGTQKNIESDVTALQQDMAKLTSQIADVLAAKGSDAWRRARSNVEGAVADAQAKGSEAMGAVRSVSDNMVDALDKSLQRNPYATLAIAVGLGFIFGATWRR